MKHPRLSVLSAIAVFATTYFTSAEATTLVVNKYVSLSGTTVVDEPYLAGTIVKDVLSPFSFAAYGGRITGQLQSRVVLAVDGTYDFYWRVFNDATSSGDIGDFRLGGYLLDTYDANWRIDGLGDTAPQKVYLFGGGGGNLNFRFFDGYSASKALQPGYSSTFFFLDTNAKFYAYGGYYDFSDKTAQGAGGAGYGFMPSVPEAGSLAMMLAGLGVLGFATRKRA